MTNLPAPSDQAPVSSSGSTLWRLLFGLALIAIAAGAGLASGLPVAPLVLLGLVIAGGTVATYWYDPTASLISRLCLGILTGLLAFGLLGLGLGLLLGTSSRGVALAAMLTALPLAGLSVQSVRAQLRADLATSWASFEGLFEHPNLPRLLGFVGALAAIGGLWLVFDRTFIVDASGIGTGFVNNLGDQPLHFGYINSFAFGANLPPTDPNFAGSTLAYPFLMDYISALLVAAGASLRSAMLVPDFLLGVTLVGVMVRWTFSLTANRLAAGLAPILLLLGGGLGWTMLADQARTGTGIISLLINPTADYTIGNSIYRFGNAITTLLIPQRDMLLGLPIAIVVFGLLWSSLHLSAERGSSTLRRRILAVAGLLTGSLIIAHTYSFVVVLGTAFLVGLLFREWRDGRWRSWLLYLAATALLALPTAALIEIGNKANTLSFLAIAFGWDHGDYNPILFWAANGGVFIALLAVGLVAARWRSFGDLVAIPPRMALFLVPFAAWFIIGNVLRVAPWIWDNIKVIFYYWVGFTPLVALVLAQLWSRSRWPGRALMVGLVLALTLSATIDVGRVIDGQTNYGEYTSDAVAFGAAIRATTPADALILSDPAWNLPVYLAGRPSLLGYSVWDHGYDPTARTRDIELIYAGGPTALALLHQYHISFVEVSPLEHNDLKVNDSFFASMHQVVAIGDYTLYEVPK